MSEASAERVRQELEKAASLVGTARRLLATGTMVDLAALDGKVRKICRGVVDLGREQGRSLMPEMEALIADLDLLAAAIRESADPRTARTASDVPSDRGTP